MKKRIISLLLAAAMTFSLTACGGNSSDDKSSIKFTGENVALGISIFTVP